MYLFALLYVIPFIGLTVLIETEWFGWATTSMIVFSGVMAFLHRHDILPYIQQHGVEVAGYFGAYVILGVVWSFAKWVLFLIKFNRELEEELIRYKNMKGLDINLPLDDNNLAQYKIHLPRNKYHLYKIPQAAENKTKIMAWMSFWPCSFVGFVLNDPVRRLFTMIFDTFRGSYQKIADAIVKAPELQNKEE